MVNKVAEILANALVKYEIIKGDMRIIALMTIIASILIILIGSVNHPDMSMDSAELLESKKSSRLIVLEVLGIAVFLSWMKAEVHIICYLMMGIIWDSVLLLVAKFVGQEVKM